MVHVDGYYWWLKINMVIYGLLFLVQKTKCYLQKVEFYSSPKDVLTIRDKYVFRAKCTTICIIHIADISTHIEDVRVDWQSNWIQNRFPHFKFLPREKVCFIKQNRHKLFHRICVTRLVVTTAHQVKPLHIQISISIKPLKVISLNLYNSTLFFPNIR